MNEIVDIFKAIAQETRLRIIRLLLEYKEDLCVCELASVLNLPQYSISRHLNVLRKAGLVEGRRDGAWMYYSISSMKDQFKQKLIETINFIPMDEHALKNDLSRLKERLSLRVDGRCVMGI